MEFGCAPRTGCQRVFPGIRQREVKEERKEEKLFLRGKLMIGITPGADLQPAANPAELFSGVHARLIAAYDAARSA